jgi:hypothetical protein
MYLIYKYIYTCVYIVCIDFMHIFKYLCIISYLSTYKHVHHIKRFVYLFFSLYIEIHFYIHYMSIFSLLTLLLMPLVGLHFYVGLDFVTPSL